MSEQFTDAGLDWVAEVLADGDADGIHVIAVGDGTTEPGSSDTEMENELYRSNSDASNVSIQTTSNPGEISWQITVTGGSEVPVGSEITEFGIFSPDGSTLVWRQVQTAVVIESGDSKTFENTVTILDQ